MLTHLKNFKIIIGGACRAGTFAPLDKIGGLCGLCVLTPLSKGQKSVNQFEFGQFALEFG